MTGFPPPAIRLGRVSLVFGHAAHDDGKPAAHDLSAAVRVGDTLFLGADESASIERLHRQPDGAYGEAGRYDLRRLFTLPSEKDELDIEGLAFDAGYLWIVGSHSRTRKKPKKGQPVTLEALAAMADLKANPNRFFLGRVPVARLAGDGDRYTLLGFDPGEPLAELGDTRVAAMLPIGEKRNAIGDALKADAHLKPFMKLPAKENGLDVEGLAVDGDRVALGLRGPVINTWAMLLEFAVAAAGTELALTAPLAKRWLDLGGLGIRDLKRSGDDLLILAGPSMALSGPVRVHRWSGWGRAGAHAEAAAEAVAAPLLAPPHVLELPFGRGVDHPEALVLLSDGRLLVVSDSPADDRLDAARGSIAADVFAL